MFKFKPKPEPPKPNIPFKPIRHNVPNEVITDYILFNPEKYQTLIEQNSAFYDEYNRYFSVGELGDQIRENIKEYFQYYTDTSEDNPEKLVIKCMLANVDYNKVAIQIYTKLCNDTFSYRQSNEAPSPAVYYNMTIEEYNSSMQEFFENKYLNF